ncbi:hypothetical protein Tco_0240994 [Tanacetum coccineum]
MQTQKYHSNPIPALNVDSLKVDLAVIQNTCSEKEDSNSKTASSKSVKESSLNSETKDVHAIKYKMSKAKERCMAYFQSLHSHLQVLSKEDLKFQQFIDLKFTLDYDSQMSNKYFVEYTGIEVKHFRDTLLQHMGNVKKSIVERTRHQRQYDKRVNKIQMQTQESKIDTGKVVNDDLVVTKSNGTESEVQDDNSRSGNDTYADDTYIRPIYDEEPMTEVQLTAECNIFAIGQQHTKKPELFMQWIPTGKLFDYCTSKDDSEPTLGSNVDIPNIHESKQTLDLSAGTSINVQKEQSLDLSAENWFKPRTTTSTKVPSENMIVMTLMIKLESLFGHLFDQYFNGENQVVSKSSVVTTVDASNNHQQQPDSTLSTSTLATTVSADGNFDLRKNLIECINNSNAFLSVYAHQAWSTKSYKVYNCSREGYMARQCTQPKRPRNAAWFKEKLMLAEAQEAGQILDEEQLAFLEFSFPD